MGAHRLGIVVLVVATCAFALGGCSAGPGPAVEETATTSAASLTATGIDFSLDKPTGAAIHAAHYSFAVRYLSGGNTKDMTRAETTALWAAGVDIVSNWELCGGDSGCGGPATVSGFATGASDARKADAEATAAGAPAGRPIYFSIDFDTQYTTPDPMPGIQAYFEGVASVIGLARTGAYGGFHTLKYLFDRGKIKWGWQTAAWLYGQGWEPRAQLRQVSFNVSVGSYTSCCDGDEAWAVDFGQWHAAAASAPQCVNNPGTGNNCGDQPVIANGKANTLYHCAGPGPATVVEVCANGCVHNPPGTDDVCAPPPDAGADAHVDAQTDALPPPPANDGAIVEPDASVGDQAAGESGGCNAAGSRRASESPAAFCALALCAVFARITRRRARRPRP